MDEVLGEEITLGVVKRVLLKPEQSGRGPPGDLTVTHYVLTDGVELTLEEPNVEYQDYIVSGSALFGRRYVHANTTIFVPSDRKHTFTVPKSGKRIKHHLKPSFGSDSHLPRVSLHLPPLRKRQRRLKSLNSNAITLLGASGAKAARARP